MGRYGRWGSAALAVVLLGASFLYIRFLTVAGRFTTINQPVPAACETLAAVPGPEDIVIDPQRGFAYVAATDRRLIMKGGAGADAVRGGIYVINTNQPVAGWELRPVTPNEPESFRPHGLGFLIDEAGGRSLFVVNHPAGGADTVEIFDVATDGELTHRRTVSDPLFVSLNDVQPVGRDAFYATNDHGPGGEFWRMVQDFLMLDRANLVYFDGETARIAADGLSFANGVNISPDGETVYVAETIGMGLRIYARDPATGMLTLSDYVALGTGVDNIDVLPDGTLLIGAHPKLLDFLDHADDPSALSPSQVVLITPGEGGGGAARTIYLNFGEEISGSSVAAGYGEIMMIGAVFEPKILICQRDLDVIVP